MIFRIARMTFIGIFFLVSNSSSYPILDCLDTYHGYFKHSTWVPDPENSHYRAAIWEPDPDNFCSWKLGYRITGEGNRPGVTIDFSSAFEIWGAALPDIYLWFEKDYLGYMANRAPSGAKIFFVTVLGFSDWLQGSNTWGITTQQIYEEDGNYRLWYSTIDILHDRFYVPPLGIQVVVEHEIGHGLMFAKEPGICPLGDGYYTCPPGASMGSLERNALNCGYNWRYSYDCANRVEAMVSDFWVDENGMAGWSVLSEAGVISYFVEGLDGDNWVEVGEVSSTGVGSYSLDLSATNFPRYRLLEKAVSHHKILSYASPGNRVFPAPNSSSLDISLQLDAAKNAFLSSNNAVNELGLRSEDKLLVIGPGSFIETVRLHSSLLWEATWGCRVEYVDVASFGVNPDSVRVGIRGAIGQYREIGFSDFLLVGSANDYIQFQSDMWANFWWDDIRTDYISAGFPVGGYPEFDFVPTWYYEDSMQPDLGMSAVSPYWYSDIGYSDLNMDGLPDVNVVRWPVVSNDDILVLLTKIYNNSTQPIFSLNEFTRTAFLVGDESYRVNVDDASIARETAREFLAEMPIPIVNWDLYMSEIEDLSERNFDFSNLVNSSAPNLVIAYSNGSNGYSVGGFLDFPSWNMSLIDEGVVSGFLAATCLTADYARTYSVNNGPSVFLDFLFEPQRGANFWIGPVNATWQKGNREMIMSVSKEIFSDNPMSLSRKFFNAQVQVLNEFSSDIFVSGVARSYSYFGCPLSPFRSGGDSPVGVPGHLDSGQLDIAAYPNPFNPQVEFQVFCKIPQNCTMDLFDVRGNKITTIFSGELLAGESTFHWDGRDSNGGVCPAGVYFVRISGAEASASKKLLLVK